MNEVFGSSEFVNDDLLRFLVRLAVNIVFVGVVVHGVYNRIYRNREYVFTYYLFNLITFGMCLLLSKVPIELGFALGLFAVFGILRYRTEAIRIRDLTYLFIVLGLGILNGVANTRITVAEILVANTMIVGMTVLLEVRPRGRTERSAPTQSGYRLPRRTLPMIRYLSTESKNSSRPSISRCSSAPSVFDFAASAALASLSSPPVLTVAVTTGRP